MLVPVAKFTTGFINTGGKFVSGAIDIGGPPFFYFRISQQIFKNILNDPNIIFRGMREDDLWKNGRKKSCYTVPLN